MGGGGDFGLTAGGGGVRGGGAFACGGGDLGLTAGGGGLWGGGGASGGAWENQDDGTTAAGRDPVA